MTELQENKKRLLTVVVHNGLANRLLPLVSCLRLAKQSGRLLNVIFNGTPVRSCIRYDGAPCKYYDLFEKNEENIVVDSDTNGIIYERTYNFEYWLNKEMIIDVSGLGHVYTNFGFFTIIGVKDDQTSMCKLLVDVIAKPGEIKFDGIAKELGEILRKDMKPVAELQREIDKYKNSRFKKNMLGIHIRSTDGGFVDIKWDKMVQELINKTKIWCAKSEENGVFLATDNRKYYVDFVSKLMTDQFVFYNPPEKLCGTESTNVENFNNDKFNNDKFNVLCGLVEMYLLGECNKGVVGTAQSTFSVCGMLIGEGKKEENNIRKNYLIKSVEDIPEGF